MFVGSGTVPWAFGKTLGYEKLMNSLVLLMVQKSGVHQLRLVVYPIIYKVLAPAQVVVWDFSHQQYGDFCLG